MTQSRVSSGAVRSALKCLHPGLFAIAFVLNETVTNGVALSAMMLGVGLVKVEARGR